MKKILIVDEAKLKEPERMGNLSPSTAWYMGIKAILAASKEPTRDMVNDLVDSYTLAAQRCKHKAYEKDFYQYLQEELLK